MGEAKRRRKAAMTDEDGGPRPWSGATRERPAEASGPEGERPHSGASSRGMGEVNQPGRELLKSGPGVVLGSWPRRLQALMNCPRSCVSHASNATTRAQFELSGILSSRVASQQPGWNSPISGIRYRPWVFAIGVLQFLQIFVSALPIFSPTSRVHTAGQRVNCLKHEVGPEYGRHRRHPRQCVRSTAV
jgi:hypothetical protein